MKIECENCGQALSNKDIRADHNYGKRPDCDAFFCQECEDEAYEAGGWQNDVLMEVGMNEF